MERDCVCSYHKLGLQCERNICFHPTQQQQQLQLGKSENMISDCNIIERGNFKPP